ncbi:hypothetical protein [Cytophaga sp. FL35]|uniref:hypothetical protein n=1 Tax=Cytophaga sp. FL35 TaxID=1904456 RepID=UPI0016536BB8|nr:hypothetical protein [Cytophaga sp. FL35]MBC6998625.1 hypothetical protein [Cytophaga sp. FL35]
MEEKQTPPSIWGPWWATIRKWFYPAWLLYETFIRFYGYSSEVQVYLATHLERIAFMDQRDTQVLATFGGVLTFVVCTISLSLPLCFICYHFFLRSNLTHTLFEKKLKFLL